MLPSVVISHLEPVHLLLNRYLRVVAALVTWLTRVPGLVDLLPRDKKVWFLDCLLNSVGSGTDKRRLEGCLDRTLLICQLVFLDSRKLVSLLAVVLLDQLGL